MNELDKYGALLEPTIGLPYSTSGGYGPGGLFVSPMADYYAAFAPSTYFNRAFIDQAAEPQPRQQSNQQVMAMPASDAYLTQDQRDRLGMTEKDINDYYSIFQKLSGRDDPYWPRAILIEPESTGIEKEAAGIYSPYRQVIELYQRSADGYISPDLKYVDEAYWQPGQNDKTLPHELGHFIDDMYNSNDTVNTSIPPPAISRPAFARDNRAYGETSGIHRSVLYNEMPPFQFVPEDEYPAEGAIDWFAKTVGLKPSDVTYIHYPDPLKRPMAEGNTSERLVESELYADQLGKALNLWKNAYVHPEGEQYAIEPVTLNDMANYNAVAERSPYIELGNKLMSPEMITIPEVAQANEQALLNSMAFARPNDRELTKELDAARRQDEIARTILMEMALRRLQSGANRPYLLGYTDKNIPPEQRPIVDPVTKQLLPVSGF